MKKLPRYPIYIVSKGRADCCLTANSLQRDNVPFKIVIEPQEEHLYLEHYSKEKLLILPFSNLGQGSIPARNAVFEHAVNTGHKRHWCLDDNINGFYRAYGGKRIYCHAGIALRVTEDFTDRYENIALSGMNYGMFGVYVNKPFRLNCHIYSIFLILNSLDIRWRGRHNEDTDLCLQALSEGWCIVQINAFLANKIATMTMKGGNEALYEGDGRLKSTRAIVRQWPKVVELKRKFKRPHHHVRFNWRKFDTQLIRRKDIKIPAGIDEYGMELKALKEVKSERLKKLIKKSNENK